MLSWTQRSDGWHSNGFHIELAAPYRWLLLETEKQVSTIRRREPLAVTRSLAECKREAELLVAKRRRLDLVRRQIVTLVLVVAVTPLLLGNSSNADAAVVLVVLAIAIRSTIVLLGALMPRALGKQHEVFYR